MTVLIRSLYCCIRDKRAVSLVNSIHCWLINYHPGHRCRFIITGANDTISAHSRAVMWSDNYALQQNNNRRYCREKPYLPYIFRVYISWNYCQIVELQLLHCFSPLFRPQYLKLSGIVFKIGSISEENCALNLNFLTSYGGFKFMFCFTIETLQDTQPLWILYSCLFAQVV